MSTPTTPPPDGPETIARTLSPWGDLVQTLPTYEARLHWTDSLGPHEHALTSASILGSSPSAPIRVADPTVSRVHLELTPTPSGLGVKDVGTLNGTFVGGRSVRDITLLDGDLLMVGSTEIRIRLVPEIRERYLWPSTQFAGLIARSAVMRDLFVKLARVARTDSTVLIHGESGTGKEQVARGIHDHSSRASGPFIVVDCGAFHAGVMESELFGHKRGAFTGATEDSNGAFQKADGGTLFLDEIGDLALSLQPKLLRAIQERQVRRLGETEYKPVNVRFVSASHKDLKELVKQGEFRDDLYFRLAVLPVELPALRDRAEDIPLLLRHFLPPDLQDDVKDPALAAELMALPWKGNVRALKNFAEQVVALGWKEAIRMARDGDGPSMVDVVERDVSGGVFPQALLRLKWKEAREKVLAWFQREYVTAGLDRHGGDMKKLAEEAEIGLSQMYRVKGKSKE